MASPCQVWDVLVAHRVTVKRAYKTTMVVSKY